MVDALNDGTAIRADVRRIGPRRVVFERLWRETGRRTVIEQLTRERKHGFTFERAVFLTVLHRLFAMIRPGRRSVAGRITGSMASRVSNCIMSIEPWPGSARNCRRAEQDGRTICAALGSATRTPSKNACSRSGVIWFSKLDLVFMDTTSPSFYGEGGETLGAHGYSKDYRPDPRQMILAVLLDGDGRPVCTEMWPGNTADTGSLCSGGGLAALARSIACVCIVADRGMISAETIAELEARGLLYILGVRERTGEKLVRELALDHPGPFVLLVITKRGKSVDYEGEDGGARWSALHRLPQSR